MSSPEVREEAPPERPSHAPLHRVQPGHLDRRTRAAFRYSHHEVARRLEDLPNDPTGVVRDPIDAATGLFVLHCLHRNLRDRAAAELAAIIDTVCNDVLTWDAVFTPDRLIAAGAAGLIAPDQLDHVAQWLGTLQKTRARHLFEGPTPPGQDFIEGPGPLAQGLCLRDAQALLVLAVLAIRALPDGQRWLERREARRARRRADTPTW